METAKLFRDKKKDEQAIVVSALTGKSDEVIKQIRKFKEVEDADKAKRERAKDFGNGPL